MADFGCSDILQEIRPMAPWPLAEPARLTEAPQARPGHSAMSTTVLVDICGGRAASGLAQEVRDDIS